MSTYDDAVSFFYEHAGWCYNPATETPEQGKRRMAHALAHAEEWAAQRPLHYTWEDWWHVDHEREFDRCGGGGPDTCEEVVMYDDSEEVGSLRCVDDADADYRRVVEAELALRYLGEFTVLVG